MAHDLLFEIGCEEIPARFVPGALEQMQHLAERGLRELRLSYGQVRTVGTPRRLALLVSDISEHQEDLVEEVKGPPERAAFDADGRPTQAALGFARSQQVAVEELEVKDTPQGRYVFARRREAGRAAAEVLGPWLARLVGQISFPKSMRWADPDVRFARPIRWLVALLDDQVLPVVCGDVSSDRITYGHRFLAKDPLPIPHPRAYIDTLRRGWVIVDPEERRQRVWAQVQEAARKLGGRVEEDADLLEEITHLVEYPTAIIGRFDEALLELPREVLITPMTEHQRYFPVVGADGRLLPSFIAVANTDDSNSEVIVRGNEKVLAARLADARFFFDEDRKRPLADFLPRLETVVFQEKLGTVAAKVDRVVALTDRLSRELGLSAEEREWALRAARLSKADLASQMVYEFPELQGVMGREYARASGEPEPVAVAIFEHLLPRHAGDRLPQTPAGAVVALADRFDTLAGCFAAGLTPTGSQDPYALRRAASGIVQICLARECRLSMRQSFEAALSGYGSELRARTEEIIERLVDFIGQRLRTVLGEEGCRHDLVEAVLAVCGDQPLEAARRARGLQPLLTSEAMAEARRAYDRVANLAQKATSDAVDPGLFREPVERKLYGAVTEAEAAMATRLAEDDMAGAVELLAGLAPAVDDFFEQVLVMADDPSVRTNRLALLKRTQTLFHQLADFSLLEGGRDAGHGR